MSHEHLRRATWADLHNEDGSHRTTPPTTCGHCLETFERQARNHKIYAESNGRQWCREGVKA